MQVEAIQLHLINQDKCNGDTECMLEWVEHYSEGFRVYINSIKQMVYAYDVISEALSKKNEPTWDEFLIIEKVYNKDKELLESVF